MSLTPSSLSAVSEAPLARSQTFAPSTLEEAFKFADVIIRSGMAPKAYKAMKPEEACASIVVVLQFGMEVGFQPMQALQCIANINGMPSVWGDGAIGLVRSSGLLEYIKEDDFETIKANKKATCIVKRRGDPEEVRVTFSYDDAVTAGIFSNAVWKTYPYRMCQMRARAFALRDTFPEVLKGLSIAEEVQDYTTIQGNKPEPAATIQPSIVVPEKQAATVSPQAAEVNPGSTAEKTEPQATEKVAEPAVTDDKPRISMAQAKEFYETYKANGHTPDDARIYLREAPLSENVSDSRKILLVDFPICMEWARTKAAAQ